MRFVSLSRSLLLDFKSKGYNVLTSYNAVDYQNPTWQPIRVPHVQEYLLQLNFNSRNLYLKESTILVIEDALTNLKEEELVGEVFIEDNHRQRLKHNCKLYDIRYHFMTNPEIYDFSFDPHRILIRNHALRTGDDAIYMEYLQMHYPAYIYQEIADLKSLANSLICLDAVQARKWFKLHHITVMESDIWICDEDAILKVFAVKEHNRNWDTLDDSEEMIHNLMKPNELLLLRDIFWIDPRMIV